MEFGVPQGSLLGPLLFVMFISDITCQFVYALLYADDMTLYSSVDSEEDYLKLQKNLELLRNWSIENRTSVNINKCVSMNFTGKNNPTVCRYNIDSITLNACCEFKDLIVTFDLIFF